MQVGTSSDRMNSVFLLIFFVSFLPVEMAGQALDGIAVFNQLFSATDQALDSAITASLGPKTRSSGSADTKPSSKTFEAKVDVERAFHQAWASPANRNFTQKRLNALVQSIDLAVQTGSLKYARWALGTGIFGQNQIEQTSRRKRRSPAETFLQTIMKKIGILKFQKLMSVKRSSTLMFAIDTTGSMGEEIQAAKNITTAIINWPRNHSIAVTYVLSPFSDPGKHNFYCSLFK